MDIAGESNMKPDTTPQAPAIEFRNVFLRFDDHVVLNDISFKLDRGEMILLTGVSGSGKSVLLRLAMGLLRPDSGQIFVEGQEIDNLNESELLDIRGGLMGMVFQEDSLFTGLPVYENAAYRLEEHGWLEEEIERAVKEVLRFVGLDGEEEKFPEELSGGMKRRLEIARALNRVVTGASSRAAIPSISCTEDVPDNVPESRSSSDFGSSLSSGGGGTNRARITAHAGRFGNVVVHHECHR
jgi:ABC-type multidrug transport system fused ATPase/permease subunit